MNDRTSIEVTADSVDDAIRKGLTELGVSASDVIVEVIDEPSRGVFGIGARPAKVRLQVIRRPAPPPPPVAAQPPPPEPAPIPEAKPQAPPKPARKAPRHKSDDYEYNDEEDAYAFSETEGDAAGEDGDISKAVLTELLAHMQVTAEVKVTRAAASQSGENPPWLLNIEGREISALIGRRGDTLASLQYITRLIASRKLGRRANIVVDVGGYKARRAQKLRELAVRMADQAIREERTVVLEPMPPHERRMIHMALRSRGDVTTKSIGDGDSRKVTIVPK